MPGELNKAADLWNILVPICVVRLICNDYFGGWGWH